MRYSICLFVLLVLACEPNYDLPITIDLNTNWEFRQQGDSLWRSASVPGNVFTDLLDHKLIKDPFTGTHEKEVQWVSESNWEYKTMFSLSEALLSKRYVELNFEGLDTYASVYLNDSLILSSNNAFRSWKLNPKPLLKETNELRVEFNAPSTIEAREKRKLSYELPEGNRVFTRKAQFQYGWDWGPKLNVMGLWRPVRMVFSNEGRLNNVTITKDKVSDSLAILSLSFNAINSYEANLQYEVLLNQEKITTLRDTFPYSNKYVKLNIKNPIFWWPHNVGDPYLYDITIVAKDGNKILDSISTKYGIREVALITEIDSLGESFYFKVNGVPVYAKGANYIPQHSFQNRVTGSSYNKLLDDVVDANMNMLRVWGGGIYEEDEFYAKCDEKGIMVWQDFMFACAMYPGDQNFVANVTQEAIDNLKRLGHHPSIALWCGNNENSEGWNRWGWQDGRTEKEKKEIWTNYLKLFDSVLPRLVQNYSDVNYWESSPKYGRGNFKYEYEGDAHDWWVWHDGYPFEHFENHVPRFMSEFGFQSFPSSEVIKLINDSQTINLATKAVKNHQKHGRGFQLIDDYMARDYPIPEQPDDYIYMSQLVQAYGITKGIEAHRRAKPYNMGSLYWQLNDCWPAVSWSGIDFLGKWKALHYKVKESFKNVIVSPKLTTNGALEVWVVNDHKYNFCETLSMKILDFKGELLWCDTKPVEISSDSSFLATSIRINELNFDWNAVVMELNLGNESKLFYFSKPKNLSLLEASISSSITKVHNGFEIELLSPVLQKDVFLSTKGPGHFSTNFFDIMPNKPIKTYFKTQVDTLTDLKITSFNNFIR